MNIILFKEEELNKPLFYTDYRYQHITQILKATVGQKLTAGIIEGSLGEIEIIFLNNNQLNFSFTSFNYIPSTLPLTVILGVVRPPTLRRLLKDLSTYKVQNIWLTYSDLTEGNYSKSKIWQEIDELLVKGAEQGKSTILPKVKLFNRLNETLESLNQKDNNLYCCHMKGTNILKLSLENNKNTTIAIGCERGWSEREIISFEKKGFEIISLGDAILRTEVAVDLSVGILSNLIIG